MFQAATLDALPNVVGLHEGHTPGEPPVPRLPLINLQNVRAWHDAGYAERMVGELRDCTTLSKAARDEDVLIDVAFYNAPLLVPLARQHADSVLFVTFRRCEEFVRSATIVSGEDDQPAGWPDPSKPLTDREKFISFGRLRPAPGSADAQRWEDWSAIQRNIWLWHKVNAHLLRVADSHSNCHTLLYEDLAQNPEKFWVAYLRRLGCLTEANLALCVTRSAHKINQRVSYQVGPAATWAKAERAFLKHLAEPLERRIYE